MAGVVERHEERDDEITEGAVAFLLTKPVDLAKLDREIAEAHDWETTSGLTIEGHSDKASEEEPVTLWVHHPDVRANLVRKVTEAHEIVADSDIEFLRDKVLSDEPLTDIEIQQALRALLRRAH